MNTEKRNALLSIIFYVISIIAVVIINLSGQFKSGPCTPNLDFFSIFIVAILNVILLITNAISTFGLKKETKNSFFIHLFVFSLFIIWIMTLIINS
ncbi:hypothetical protein C3L50_00330 [Flavobacterium alvei]|uniref:Uncharacterized protein n=1 Tax=Flavobacterium alvei TaxID=2080416 RepID=A0A2S5AFD2_9FLAO|nr:hypothetical protein C3L50_00330 [Flavobacterium alvei]